MKITGCICEERPRCEWRHCDSPAKWSVFQPEVKHQSQRFKLMCAEHFEMYRDALTKPMIGLDPPKGASDFWQPSLLTMIDLSDMEIRRQDKVRVPPPIAKSEFYREGDEQRYTPGQLKQILIWRRHIHEMYRAQR